MPDTESDHHRGLAAVARLDLVAPPAAPATARSVDEDDGFTFSAVADSIPRLQDADGAFPDARIGSPVYPVFGRPRWSPPKEQEQQQDEEEEEEEEEEDTAAAGMATVRRVPLERLLLEEQSSDCAPSASGQQQQPVDDADADAELDGVPAETYCCLWSPGVPPPAQGVSPPRASPACCQKSGSTAGSSVLRWRRRRVAVEPSHSDCKDEFGFVGTSSDRIGAGGEQGWMNRGSADRGGGKSSSTAFLSCRQDLVELVVSAVTCRRSCYLI